jgi:23S rRNA pseudouridine2605 synthase
LRGVERDAHGAKVMVHDPHRTHGRPPGQARADEEEPDPPISDSGVDEGGGDRVAKVLARAGVASRREVERLIAAGRVALNGAVLNTPAVKVEPGDIVTVDGEVVSDAEPARLFRYHKPTGLVTSHNDPKGRPTVFQALPEGLPRLISVGRLDLSSEGLLLLTNDGGLARALEMPTSGVVRRYRARALGRVTQERLDKLKDGITVEGVRYGSIEARLDKAKEGPQGANLWITVTLAEGKNREVRRVLEALGLKVNRLIRLSYGPFALGTLLPGQVEEVGPRVIREQLAEHIAPGSLPKGDRPAWRMPAKMAAAMAAGRRAPAERRANPAAGETPQKKVYKAGWAKPKPKTAAAKAAGAAKFKAAKAAGSKPRPAPSAKGPGSMRAGGPPAGPRGPKPSASRPGTRPARRPGPPRSGGRGPRG